MNARSRAMKNQDPAHNVIITTIPFLLTAKKQPLLRVIENSDCKDIVYEASDWLESSICTLQILINTEQNGSNHSAVLGGIINQIIVAKGLIDSVDFIG